MERTYDEKNLIYFCKRARSSALMLLILSFGMGSIGYTRDGTHVFLVIAAVFATMAIWQFIKVKIIRVTGAEIDESATRIKERVNLVKNAAVAFNLEQDDLERLNIISFSGYTPRAIETEALLRYDNEDEKARSSNYQLSVFFLDESIMFAYTETHSLVDSEYTDSSRIWRYVTINNCEIDCEKERCLVDVNRPEERKDGTFDRIILYGENGEAFAYYYEKENTEAAELLERWLQAKIKKKSRLKSPKNAKKSRDGANQSNLARGEKRLSKYEENALSIGMLDLDFRAAEKSAEKDDG